ncbi:MAG: DUF3667 domain-containing protein [Ignavibacteriales bacterium]|nr:DUF3667 domain-containing protein [Ignavibacteriales bacterium]
MAHIKNKSKDCLNCGYVFNDANNYCPHCGQENNNYNIPLKHMFLELLEGTIHFDTKSFQTFLVLLFKPGHLTLQYNQGKRVRYVPPLRLYVFISFLFLITISILPSKSPSNQSTSKFDFEIYSITSLELTGLKESKLDSLLTIRKIEKGGFAEYLIHKLWNLSNDSGKEFGHSLVKNISYMIFILMPFFGWLVFLFHKKRKSYYFEYLIYSIHFHSFLFLALFIFILISMAGINIYVLICFLLWMLIYLYKSLRKVFTQKRFSAVIKSFFLSILYFFSLLAFFLATVVLSIAIFNY